MRKLLRLSLFVLLAFVLFFANIPAGFLVDRNVDEVQAATVKLSKKKLTLYVKQKYTLKLTGTKKKAKWTSSKKKIAKVSSKGKVTAVKPGKAKITAKIGKKKYTCTVTVINPAISNTAVTVNTGSTCTLSVTGAVGTVAWSSANSKVATVNAAGQVKGISGGSTVITAKASGLDLTCKVTVIQLVTGIKLNQTAVTVDAGKTVALTATVSPSNARNKGVTWTSSNTKVATVNANGLVTGKGPGTATITVTAMDAGKKKATAAITVKQPVTGVSLNKTSATLDVGATLTLVATVAPSNAGNKAVTWASSNSKVATVSANGLVTAKAEGTATITVTTKDQGKKVSAKITVVRPKINVESVTFDQDAVKVDVGNTAKCTYKVLPESVVIKEASFVSSNPEVASVDETGLITGLKSGSAEIKITVKDNYDNEKSATMTVTVIRHVENITLNENAKTLYLGGSAYTIIATVLPDDANNKGLTYSSSNEGVATVSGNGVVTPVSAGNAVITVKSVDQPSVTASLAIKVENADASSRTVATAEELTAALAEPDLKQLTIASEGSLNLTIPEGDHPDLSLIVNAPLGHIVNNTKFKEVTIKAISRTTYVENAGNTINYQAGIGSVKIGADASAIVNVGEGAGTLDLINDGSVSALTVTSPGTEINIQGDSGQLSMPVNVASEASGTEISTSRDLDISADSRIDLQIMSGGETTSVTVNNEESIPDVTGLGRIPVTVSDTGNVENIVAGNTGQQEGTERYTISGTIKDADGSRMNGVAVYLIPYSASAGAETVNTEDALQTAVSQEGSYSLEEIVAGNYYIYIAQEGYLPILDTVILYNESQGQGKNYLLIPASQEAVKGDLAGTLKDAETGSKVEEGLTVYLRAGLNNISGPALSFTQTDDKGAFAFADLDLGQYTIEVIDRRGDQESYYISNSYSVVVSKEGVNRADQTLTKVLNSDQVRFVLTWEARQDLDSHLIGPKTNGGGRFHIFPGDGNSQYRALNEEGEIVRYAKVSGDENPETSTIYVKTDGLYSFYVYDFSGEVDGLRNSSALVKAYIGSKLMATYHCPAQDGRLWYVCDYNSATNKFTTKNVVSEYDGGEENIGIEELERARQMLSEAIELAEGYLAQNPALADQLTGTTIENAKNILAASEDVEEIWQQYDYINTFNSYLDEGLGIDWVHMYDDEGRNLITYWNVETDNSGSSGINLLKLRGLTDRMSTLSFSVLDGSAAEMVTPDKEGYDGAVKVTSEHGVSRTYYIRYAKETFLAVEEAHAWYYNDDGDQMDWIDSDPIVDTLTINGEEINRLTLYGTAPQLPEDLEIIGSADAVNAFVDDSDRDGFQKMVTLSYGNLSTTYYILYQLSEVMSIKEIIWTDDEGERVSLPWFVEEVYDTQGENIEYHKVVIKGYTETMPDNLEVETCYDFVSGEIKESDRGGFDRMVLITYGDQTLPYYIEYMANDDLYIADIRAVDEYENDLISNSTIETALIVNEETGEEEDIWTVSLEGSTAEIPETLEIIPAYKGIRVEVIESDREGFDRRIILSNLGNSRTYYMTYTPAGLLDIGNVYALDDEGNNLISEEDRYLEEVCDVDEETGEETTHEELGICGEAESLPESLVIEARYDFVDCQIRQSDREGYEKMVVLSYGERSRTIYIRYRILNEFGIGNVDAYDEEGNALDVYSDTESVVIPNDDPELEYIDHYKLNIHCNSEQTPYRIEVTPRHSFCSAETLPSDRNDYEKMVVVSHGEDSRTYYVNYMIDGLLDIESASALDSDGNNLIERIETEEVYTLDEETGEEYIGYYKLNVYGTVESLPENLTIQCRHSFVDSQILDSDRTGFEKRVVVSYGGESKTYYISYSLNEPYSIGEVTAYDEEGNNLITGYYSEEVMYYNEETWEEWIDYYRLDISGTAETLPDNVEIKGRYDFVDSQILESDRGGFEKMVAISYGGEVRFYYITYTCVAGEDPDPYDPEEPDPYDPEEPDVNSDTGSSGGSEKDAGTDVEVVEEDKESESGVNAVEEDTTETGSDVNAVEEETTDTGDNVGASDEEEAGSDSGSSTEADTQ